jgi:hypothetical protein
MSQSQILNPRSKLAVIWTEYVLHANAARFFPFHLFGEFQEMPGFTDMNSQDSAASALLLLPKNIALLPLSTWLPVAGWSEASQ